MPPKLCGAGTRQGLQPHDTGRRRHMASSGPGSEDFRICGHTHLFCFYLTTLYKHVTGSIMCHFCYAMNETQKPLTPSGCMEVRAAPRSAWLWRAHPEVSSLQGLQKLMLHSADEWPRFRSRAA